MFSEGQKPCLHIDLIGSPAFVAVSALFPLYPLKPLMRLFLYFYPYFQKVLLGQLDLKGIIHIIQIKFFSHCIDIDYPSHIGIDPFDLGQNIFRVLPVIINKSKEISLISIEILLHCVLRNHKENRS